MGDRVDFAVRGKLRYTDAEFAIQVAEVLGQDNGLRRGCIDKRRLGLRNDR